MATAAQVVTAILQELLVQAAEQDLESSETTDTIFAMNNYMTAQDANGISLGYTVVTNLGDQITVPAGAIMGMIANIAIMVAPQFDVPIPQGLAEKARVGLSAMRKLSRNRQPTQMPSTSPIGSGNEWDHHGWNSDHFYPGADEDILTETGLNIGLESNT